MELILEDSFENRTAAHLTDTEITNETLLEAETAPDRIERRSSEPVESGSGEQMNAEDGKDDGRRSEKAPEASPERSKKNKEK